jgi:hypothetical protein
MIRALASCIWGAAFRDSFSADLPLSPKIPDTVDNYASPDSNEPLHHHWHSSFIPGCANEKYYSGFPISRIPDYVADFFIIIKISEIGEYEQLSVIMGESESIST